jgi:polysaccharide biosynthesis transport protein
VGNSTNSPILDITLIDKNTQKIVDYLNGIVTVLSEDQLNRKNQYATNAIAFIDEQILRVRGELTDNAEALNDYRKKNKIYSLDGESGQLNEKLVKLDAEKESITRQLTYYSSLKNYLLTSSSFTEIPAPSIAGIGDANILGNVSKINDLSVQKSKLQYSVRSDASVFNDLNRQIEGLKNVLLENISSVTNGLKREFETVNSKLSDVESQFSKLPEDQQQLITIKRQYSLSEQTYNAFLAKRGEAQMIKASNVSDILVIDAAKNTGAEVISRNLNVRYVFAFFAALMIPLLFAFVLTFLDVVLHRFVDIKFNYFSLFFNIS